MNTTKPDSDRLLALQLVAKPSFVGIVSRFTETTARAFGMGKEEALKLRLAAEEIYSYLCVRVCLGESMDIRCVNGTYYTRIEFRFPFSELNLEALNITSAVRYDREEDLAQMGLILASRSIDRLTLFKEPHGGLCLAVEKVKVYPPVSVGPGAPVVFQNGLRVATPDAEAVKAYVNRVAQMPADPLRPSFFNYPGQVIDRIAAGDHQAVTAGDGAGHIAGGILFRVVTERIVGISGFQIFDPSREAEIATLLLDACIARTAKTKAIGLVSLQNLPATVCSQFDLLGRQTFFRPDGPALIRSAYFRFLHEDPGCTVWADPQLEAYLGREYRRLFLVREIREVRDCGEAKTGVSIFSAEMHRERSEVTLRPLWPGADQAENLTRHLRFLSREGFLNILFELDLGVPWHASLVPVLITCRFTPAMIIPFAGQADRVVFQYHGTQP